MNEEFINTYIEIMNGKIVDLTKNEVMLATKASIAEKLVKVLKDENDQLKAELEKLQASLNKRASKKQDDVF
jgi:chaperonin cofactor prefoldin